MSERPAYAVAVDRLIADMKEGLKWHLGMAGFRVEERPDGFYLVDTLTDDEENTK